MEYMRFFYSVDIFIFKMGLHKNFKGRTLKKIDRAWRSFLKADLERKKNGVTIACRERDITNSIIKK